MIQNELVTKINYITPLRYISGRIVSYDISKANINMLADAGYINQDYYEYLFNLPKMEREITIGLMIRKSPFMYDIIKNGIKDAKIRLAEMNQVEDNEIIRVANDAVYINRPIDLKNTQITDRVFFKQDKAYDAFMAVANNVYVFMNTGNMDMDVVGISDICMGLHLNGMMSFIAEVIIRMTRMTYSDVFTYISAFAKEYVEMNLPIYFYREFNADSMYCIRNNTGMYVSHADESMKNMLNIDFNYNIIRRISTICFHKYTMVARN